MKATIAYFTNRANPRLNWFCDSLVRQTTPEQRAELQIVFVDALLWDPALKPGTADRVGLSGGLLHNSQRALDLDAAVAGRFDFLHIAPLPTVWQGPWRQTPEDCFAASNARNTALVVADKPYLLCVDDLSVLAPGWFDNARHAAENGYVVCGAYQKLRAMEVTDGELVMCDPDYRGGIDSRWDKGSAAGIVPWSGSGLFGCSFGVPVDLAIKIDGFDTHCDGQGAEDYDFGIRLERAGGKVWYNRNMLTYESEEAHTEDTPLKRSAKLVPPDRLPEVLKAAHPDGLMSDHVMLQALLHEPGRILPLGSPGIAQLREQWKRDRTVPTPIGSAVDWRDGSLLGPVTIEPVSDQPAPAPAEQQPASPPVEAAPLPAAAPAPEAKPGKKITAPKAKGGKATKPAKASEPEEGAVDL